MPKYGQLWKLDPDRLGPFGGPYRPWLDLWARGAAFPSLAQLTASVEEQRVRRAGDERPLCFVQSPPPPQRQSRNWATAEMSYDAQIALLDQVPCLPDSYHDLFNALTFAAFPRAKRRLHKRQYQASFNLEEARGRRSRERDALTVLDENMAVVVLPHSLSESWRDRRCVVDLGLSADQAQVALFGHGLLERLHEGHHELRASALVLWQAEPASGFYLLEDVDHFLSNRLDDPRAFQRPQAEAILEWDRNGRYTIRPADPARVPQQHK